MVDKSNPKALEKHIGDIKERLVIFSRLKPHGPELMAEVRRTLVEGSESNLEALLIMTQDEFIHCRRLRCSNRRVLDHFIEKDKLLTEEDRENLDGFRDFHLGLLEVMEHRPHTMVVRNLINGWQGEAWASVGVESMAERAPVGSYILSGLVYFGDTVWFSGCQTLYENTPQKASEIAISMARQTPSLMVRGNPERIRAGFATQAERHDLFVEHFGSDYIVCDSATLGSTMSALERFCMEHLKGPDGLTFKERCIANGEPEKWENLKLPKLELPEDMRMVEEVTISSTPDGGIHVDMTSPPIIAALEAANLKAVLKHGKRLRQMITTSDIPPTAIRIMAGNHSELFGDAVKQIFKFRTFDVTRDLEPLLYKYKGMGTEPPRYPTLTMVEPDDPIFREVHGTG